MRVLIACLLCLLSLPTLAEIYKYTDAKGNTVFTNQPPEGQKTETVKLPPTNTVLPPPAPTNGSTPSSDNASAPANSAVYSVLELANIPDEEALRANNGTFTVRVNIQPNLQPGHSLQLMLDGKPYGSATTGTQLQVSSADRGEHSLAVEVLNNGQSIQQSPTVTFTLQRTSVNSPARRAP